MMPKTTLEHSNTIRGAVFLPACASEVGADRDAPSYFASYFVPMNAHATPPAAVSGRRKHAMRRAGVCAMADDRTVAVGRLGEPSQAAAAPDAGCPRGQREAAGERVVGD